MKKIIKITAIGVLLLLPLRFQAQNLQALLAGLKAKETELKNTEIEKDLAKTKMDTEVPVKEASLISSENEKTNIFNEHNDKHEKGTAAFVFWNNKYLEVSVKCNSLTNEIAKLRDDYKKLEAKQMQQANERLQLSQEIYSLLIKIGSPCSAKLSENSSAEDFAACGQVDWDGQKVREQLNPNILHGLHIEANAVLDESDAESKNAKLKVIDELIRKSSATHSTNPVKVVPPLPEQTIKKEPSLSERLEKFLINIRDRNKVKTPSNAVMAVRG